MIDKTKIPFDVKYLQNPHYRPSESDKGCDGYNECLNRWEEAEKEVMYSNIRVEWDSCDCGGEYGCSHPSYWTDIKFIGTKAIINEELGRLQFEGLNGAYLSIDYENMTMAEFEKCCDVCAIPLISKNTTHATK